MIFGFNNTLVPKEAVRTLTWEEQVKEALVDKDYVEEALPSKMAMNKPRYMPIVQPWDGEKTIGELSNPVEYIYDHEMLATRSWQMYTESDAAKILIKSYVEWIIGKGLTLQSEPIEEIIKAEGYTLDEKFTEITEKRFMVLTKSKRCSHNRRMTFGQLQRLCQKNATIAGDSLVIFRFDGYPTAEVVDTRYLKTPDRDMVSAAESRGNKIIHGVEVTPSGEHYAYYIQKQKNRKTVYTQVLAKGADTGRTIATLVYGDEYRIDSTRGMPIYASSIEKLKKMDRYIEAMVGGAEERAKVPWFFFHNHFSEGENPLADQIVQSRSLGDGTESQDLTQTMDQLGNKVSLTQGKEPFNLPIGVDMKAIETSQETKLPEFVDSLFIYTCASLSMPYEIALMKFVNSYSASRMASQSWQIIMDNKRELFQSDFCQPYYELFLYTQILDNKIPANGYIKAMETDDVILQGAYSNCRFTGRNVPQADPSKEAKAQVLLLSNNLTNFDKVCENMGTGDFSSNVKALQKQYAQILKYIPKEFLTTPDSESDYSELPQEAKVE